MALQDSPVLIPECPQCGSLSVSYRYWPGAWAGRDPGDLRRVYLGPGETETINCRCLQCQHRWDEYVEGAGDRSELEFA
jgi:hypothetical protein